MSAVEPIEPPAGKLSGSVVRGVSWTAVARFGTQGTQFIGGLFLARLLTPAEYGVVASITVISGFAQLFFEMGIGASLIHLRGLTDEDLSTGFWINALGGIVFLLLMSALAPLMSLFFDQPELVYLTPIVAAGFTVSLGVAHRAQLERQLQFRFIAYLSIFAAFLALVTSVTLAALGAGPLALAIGFVVMSATRTVGLWIKVPWRPHHGISRRSASRIWKFAGGQLGFNVTNYWSRNADNLVIGRAFGAGSLGAYNRAYTLMLMPVQLVSQVLGRVMFPALSSLGDDLDRIRSAYRRSVQAINVLTVPILTILAATAPGLVPLLWGDQWLASIPLLQILAIAGVPQTMASSSGWLFQSQGRTGTMFRLSVVYAVIAVAAVIIGSNWGTKGVAVAVLAFSWVGTVPVLSIAGRLVGLSASRVIMDNAPVIVICGLTGGLMWLMPTVAGLEREDSIVVLLQLLLGTLVYLACMRTLQPKLVRDLQVAWNDRRS